MPSNSFLVPATSVGIVAGGAALWSTGWLVPVLWAFAGAVLGIGVTIAAALGFVHSIISQELDSKPFVVPTKDNDDVDDVVGVTLTDGGGGQGTRLTELEEDESGDRLDVQGPSMPHSFSTGGRYSGIIYTVASHLYDRSLCLTVWPPIALNGFVGWYGTVQQGTLIMDPLFPRVVAARSESKRNFRNRNENQPGDKSRTRVGIPLEGCVVELVRDGLQGRSEMVRRAPLLLSHPNWPLLDGSNSIYIFASDPAAKQEWLTALTYWSATGTRLQSVSATYNAFCYAMRQRTVTSYVTQSLEAERPIDGISAPAPAPGAKRRWRRSTMSTDNIQTMPSPEKESQRDQPEQMALIDIDTMMEARWMHAAPRQPSQAPKQVSRHGRSPSLPARLVTVERIQVEGSGNWDPADHEDIIEKVESEREEAESEEDVEEEQERQQYGNFAPTGEGGDDGEGTRGGEGGGDVEEGTSRSSPSKKAINSNDVKNSKKKKTTRRRKPLPTPLLPVDHFVNDLVTRVCFDLVRNPAFSEHIRARIQRQLSRLKTPDYVQSLEVVHVDPGSTAPSVGRFAALPLPSNAVWPQVVFDVSYRGEFTVTIQCNVDIRDAPAWAAVDKAIDRIEGGSTPGKRKVSGLHTPVDGWSSTSATGSSPTSLRGEGGLQQLMDSADYDWNEYQGDGGNFEASGYYPISDASSPPLRIAGPAGPEVDDGHAKEKGRAFWGSLRHHTANRLRKLAQATAAHIAKLELRVSLTFEMLEGRMCAWIPPPPGNRLFWSFLEPPKLSLKSTPHLAGRWLKYAYHASRASSWIEKRMELAFTRNMVFPAGGDIPLPLLLPVWDPRASDAIPGLQRALKSGAIISRKQRKEVKETRTFWRQKKKLLRHLRDQGLNSRAEENTRA